MDLPEINAETYIGDGLYVSFDGQHIKLRAPRADGDHFVGLEREIYWSFLRWLSSYPVLWEHFATRQQKF